MKRITCYLLLVLSSGISFAEEEVPWLVTLGRKLFGADGAEASEWSIFFGRFHILVLHVPIGLMAGLFLLECYALIRRNEDFRMATRFLFGFTALFCWIAVATGLMLAVDEYNPKTGELLNWHGVAGIVMAIIATIGYIAKRRAYSTEAGKWRFGYVMLLMAGMGVLTITGHFGGSLVHGESYLGEYAPDWVPDPVAGVLGKEIADLAPSTNEAAAVIEPASTNAATTHAATTHAASPEASGETYFAAIVKPIFDRSCVKCHGGTEGKKPKGDYNMTTFAGINNGDAIFPGNADKSLLVEMIELPVDADDHMPPEGKGQELTDLEKKQIRWWVEQGPKEDTLLKDAPVDLQQAPSPKIEG